MLPKPTGSKYAKGQADHVDAWLLSYADFITLLFMFFIIFISITYSRVIQHTEITHEPPEYSILEPSAGPIKLKAPFHEVHTFLKGMIRAHQADQDIAVEKTTHELQIDLAVARCFKPGTAELREESIPLMLELAGILNTVPKDTKVEIAAHTDDAPVDGNYADSWELSAMQAVQFVRFMVEAGVDPAMLHASGYAAGDPAVPNTDSKGNPIQGNRVRNQRIVITMKDSNSHETTPEQPGI